jgi:hypothetical protein
MHPRLRSNLREPTHRSKPRVNTRRPGRYSTKAAENFSVHHVVQELSDLQAGVKRDSK